LNILIGPNGSGKSNFIEALSLLRAMPVSGRNSDRDITGVVRRGGGVTEWIWKGSPKAPASLEAVVGDPASADLLRHFLSFRDEAHRFRTVDERIDRAGESSPIYSRNAEKPKNGFAPVHLEGSILAEVRDPDLYPDYARLADFYDGIRIFREWTFGRSSKLREPQRADSRSDRLEEDLSNLGLVLSRLRKSPKVKNEIVEKLKHLYQGLSDFEIGVVAGYVEVLVTEGDFTVPAMRLSDGTLRYLCLLAILYDPSPPPLICIEEPELGLHPDILPELADLLVQASQRTQLIVTTHSDILVDAMTEHPENVVICEKENGRTSLRRLERERLAVWLKDYRLGELWSRGHLGGNRW
jgi:predicted ATPase